MYFENLHAMKLKFTQLTAATKLRVIFSLLVLALFSFNVSAQTLVDEVDVPIPLTMQSGVPIPDLDEAVSRAIMLDSFRYSADAQPASTRQYILGASIVREYRDGGRLTRVEIINPTGSIFVVDQSRLISKDGEKHRSGVLLTSW